MEVKRAQKFSERIPGSLKLAIPDSTISKNTSFLNKSPQSVTSSPGSASLNANTEFIGKKVVFLDTASNYGRQSSSSSYKVTPESSSPPKEAIGKAKESPGGSHLTFSPDTKDLLDALRYVDPHRQRLTNTLYVESQNNHQSFASTLSTSFTHMRKLDHGNRSLHNTTTSVIVIDGTIRKSPAQSHGQFTRSEQVPMFDLKNNPIKNKGGQIKTKTVKRNLSCEGASPTHAEQSALQDLENYILEYGMPKRIDLFVDASPCLKQSTAKIGNKDGCCHEIIAFYQKHDFKKRGIPLNLIFYRLYQNDNEPLKLLLQEGISVSQISVFGDGDTAKILIAPYNPEKQCVYDPDNENNAFNLEQKLKELSTGQ